MYTYMGLALIDVSHAVCRFFLQKSTITRDELMMFIF